MRTGRSFNPSFMTLLRRFALSIYLPVRRCAVRNDVICLSWRLKRAEAWAADKATVDDAVRPALGLLIGFEYGLAVSRRGCRGRSVWR